MRREAWRAAGIAGLLLVAGAAVRADELQTRGGSRLVGRVIAETLEYVDFQIDDAGTVRIPRAAVARLERSGPPEPLADRRPETSVASAGKDQPASAARAGEGGADSAAGGQAAKQAAEMDRTIRRWYPLRGWKTSFRFGLTLRRGEDSDTALDLRYRSTKVDARKREYQFEFLFYRKDNVESDGRHVTKDNNLVAEFRLRKDIRPRWFFQSNTRYYRDPTVDLLHEATQTGGVGYRLLQGGRTQLSIGPAAGVQYAEYAADAGWHFVVGAYQDFQYSLLESFRIRQSAYFFQDPWNVASHAVRTHLEVSQKLSKIVSLGFAWDYAFESEVGGNIAQNQQRLGLNLGLDF
jgi:putative salt-induced outer membrane protein YdiY